MALFTGRLEFRGADARQILYQDGKVIWIGPVLQDGDDPGPWIGLGMAILTQAVGCGVREGAARQFVEECLYPFDGLFSWTTEEVKNWWAGAFPPDQKAKVMQ